MGFMVPPVCTCDTFSKTVPSHTHTLSSSIWVQQLRPLVQSVLQKESSVCGLELGQRVTPTTTQLVIRTGSWTLSGLQENSRGGPEGSDTSYCNILKMLYLWHLQ